MLRAYFASTRSRRSPPPVPFFGTDPQDARVNPSVNPSPSRKRRASTSLDPDPKRHNSAGGDFTAADRSSDIVSVNMKCSFKRLIYLREYIHNEADQNAKAHRQDPESTKPKRTPAVICVQDPPPHIAYHGIAGYRCEQYFRKALDVEEYRSLYSLSAKQTHLDRRQGTARDKAAARKAATAKAPSPSSVSPSTQRANETAALKLSEASTAKSYKQLATRMGLRQVAFFVRDDIPRSDTRIVSHQGPNAPYVATLELDTDSRTIYVHNMYNHDTSIDIGDLKSKCMLSDDDILLGDSNLHNELWGGDNVTDQTADSIALAHALRECGMEACLPRGTHTYSPGIRTVSPRKTSIDIVFASENLAWRISNCDIVDVRGYESDHAVTRMTIDVQPNTAPPKVQKLYDEIDAAFKHELVQTIKSFKRTPGESVEAYGAHVVLCCAAAEERIPTKRRVPSSTSRTPKHITVELEKERKALISLERNPTVGKLQDFHHLRRNTDMLMTAERRRSFRTSLTRSNTKTRYQHYKDARRASTWMKPRQSPTIPVLTVNGEAFTTSKEKADLYARTIWPEVLNKTPGSSGKSPQMPELFERTQHPCDQFVTKEEVLEVIKGLKDRKATGSDQISNELLKACSEELAPILADLFTDMFKQSVHLNEFKHAITTLLLKPYKSPDHPKSYRPVALLSCLGKVFEKLIANRYRSLAETYNLLPTLQFGAPGRDTTKALQAILGPVYTGWCTNQHTSLLSLDITGAFDRVDRAKLLQILVDKGIPDWLIRLTASFLSERSTTLNMLGTMSDPFWIDIGIPQGSPLSPILFLFSAADILALFGKKDYFTSKAKVHCFAYVDDTYLMVTSPSYEMNIKILEDMHIKLLDWATNNGFEFGAHKYSLMHFRKHHNSTISTLLPTKIPHFGEGRDAGNPVLRTQTHPMNILGVHVDPMLRWDQHVAEIEISVARKLRALLRITGSTWGRTLHEMRELYRTSILPIIAYGCGAWYNDSDHKDIKWNISQKLIKRLNDLQYSCLMQISGAFDRTARVVLEKELFIEHIVITLRRLSLAQRIRAFYHEDTALARSARTERFKAIKLVSHPYVILDGEAAQHEQAAIDHLCLRKSEQQAEKDWRSPIKRRKAIDIYLKEWSFDQSRRHWDTYRAARLSRGKDVCPALDVDFYAEWDDRSLNCYKGLTRAQSTMLLHMRTSTIGLNAHLHKLKLSDTAFCACSGDRHTAKHLFLDCRLLSKQRAALARALGHLSFKDMLTKDAFEATRWAIMHFDLAQWRSAKREAPNWKAPDVKKPKKKKPKKDKSQPGGGAGGVAPPGLAAPAASVTTSS